LSNRVDAASLGELPAAHKARAERSVESWRSHLENCREQVALHQALKAQIETSIALWAKEAERAQANVERSRAAISDPDKPFAPELTPAEMNRILREAGVTKQQAYRARKLAAMNDSEFEQYLQQRGKRRKAG
jgi:hypothetical protein